MKRIHLFTFGLIVGTAALTSFGQDQPQPKAPPKPPGAGVPKSPPGEGIPRTPPKPAQPGASQAPKIPKAPDAAPPKLPRSPDATPPTIPRSGSSPGVTPKLPKSGDALPPKSPRANDPNVDPPKLPRPGNADTPKTPRDPSLPDRRPLDRPGTSNETRKPMVPDTDKTPGKSALDPAPRPDPSTRTPRTPRPDATRPRDNATDKPDTPRTPRPDATDKPDTPRTPRPGATDKPDTPKTPRPDATDKPDTPRTPKPDAPDRPNPRDTDKPRDLDRPRDTDRNRDADPNRNPNRNRDADNDRDDIPSGFTKAMDRNARNTADRPVKQFRVDPRAMRNDPAITAAFKDLRNVRSVDQLDRAFSGLRDGGRDGRLAGLNLDRVSGRFQTRVRGNDFNPLIQSRIGQRYHLDRQFSLFAHGDVARQLNLNVNLVNNGGWNSRYVGPIYSGYTRYAYSGWYPGPQWYPAYAWMPRWSPWVQWSFWNTVLPIYDPRPFVVRPIIYDVAPVVTTYEYPVWQELPVVSSGTWIDVPPVSVPSGQDLQLLAVRFVDPGHREEDLGPRYRVWLRNNAKETLNRSFDVTAFASAERELSDQIVQAGVTVPEIAGEDTIAVDIRLPADANELVTEDNDARVPFKYLHVVVDSRNSTKEHDEENNGTVLKRGDIYPVDPAAFSTDVTAAAPGSAITIAGEGLGPEPGEVIVTVGEEQYPATIRGWYDLGIQIEVPDVDLREAADAQVLVVRGDGAASNPVPLTIAAEESIGMLPPAPEPER